MFMCCVFGDYCGYSDSRYTANILCCLERFVVTATVYLEQFSSVVCGVYFGYSNSSCSAMVLRGVWIFLVTATEYVVQC